MGKRNRPRFRWVRAHLQELPYLLWHRYPLVRIVAVMLLIWFVGGTLTYLVEDHPDYASWPEAMWSVVLTMFGAGNSTPETSLGRAVLFVVLVSGVALIGLFTANVASILVERSLRRREVSSFEMDDHLVLCNWAPRGLEWIREVHSKIVRERRPVVIVHDNPEEIDLPDKEDDPAFQDVYIVKGDPVSEVILRRARADRAHSVVILADDRQGEHADGKSILVCVALRSICRSEHAPNVVVECRYLRFRNHLRKAGADEVISPNEFGLGLLARATLFHGMTRVYHELLTVGRNANEIYLLPVPEALVGQEFVTVAQMFLRYRQDKKACLLLGICRDGAVMLNPTGREAGPLQEGDELILMSEVSPDAAAPLPLDPPLQTGNSGEE